MATPVMMPKVGISVEECILTQWHKKEGEEVKAGDLLFSYETDKSTLEEVSPVDGILLRQFVQEGDEVPVMTHVCVVGSAGESVDEFAPGGAKSAEAPVQAGEVQPKDKSVETSVAAVAAVQEGGFVKASPRAKLLAKKAGADLRYAAPTGAEGRVIERDVQTLLSAGPVPTFAAQAAFAGEKGTGIGGRFAVGDIGAPAAAAAEQPEVQAPAYEDERLSATRKAIAKSMTLSLSSIPQLTHTVSFDATEMLRLRSQIKEKGERLGLNNITLNDMVLFAVSRVLAKPEFRTLNAHFLEGNTIRCFKDVNLGVAVDTPKGLLVPTLRNAGQKSLNELAGEAKALAAACQQGKSTMEMLSGGTFTISNLGAFGVESFTPVINPPQTGILGVNTITTRVREVGGSLQSYPAMALSLTYDHRAIDGAPASRFLVELKSLLEKITLAMCI